MNLDIFSKKLKECHKAVKIHFFENYRVGTIMVSGKSRKDHSYQISFLSLVGGISLGSSVHFFLNIVSIQIIHRWKVLKILR